jgi:hypothetical protein
MQQQLALRSVSDYGYAETSALMSRLPLSTAPEARSSCFPASNNVAIPGRRGVPTAAQAPYEFTTDDGGIMRMWGKRRERHRRFLDYILSYSRPVPLAGGNQGFFIDRKAAARAVFGNARMYLDIDALAIEMQHIQVQYVRPGFNDGVGEVDPLCVGYRSSYKFGADGKPNGLDDALTRSGYDARTFDGMAFVPLSGVYLKRFITEITLRYHPALEVIFSLGPVAASLARFALSNDYLRGKPLNDVLDLLGAASGSARDRSIAELKSGPQAKLLAELGISVRLYNGKNCVFYEAATKNVIALKARGLQGVATAK